MKTPVYLAVLAFVAGCMPWAVVTGAGHGPVGSSANGLLPNGVRLPQRSEDYRFYHQRDRRYGSRALATLMENTAKGIRHGDGGAVLLVGDMSGPGGGRISGHRSHRNGLDMDLAYFSRAPSGKGLPGYPLVAYDQYGVAASGKDVKWFDLERNWAVVEALLGDSDARVQWIFTSHGLKARLLSWALHNGRDLEIIARAADVLHQPSDAASHGDHFHVLIDCPEDAAGAQCDQGRPVWHWAKPQEPRYASDDEMMALATEGLR